MTLVRMRAFREVAAPAAVVWAVVADHEGMSTWSPGVSVKLRHPGDENGAGAVRVVRMVGMTITEMVTDVEPGRRLAYRCVSGLPFRDYAGEIVLDPRGGVTGVTWVLSADVPSRLLAFVLATQARVFVRALRKAAERRHRTSRVNRV